MKTIKDDSLLPSKEETSSNKLDKSLITMETREKPKNDMKDIKPYLPLYLGCPVATAEERFNSPGLKLVGISDLGLQVRDEAIKLSYYVNPHDCKLVLRRLSDMSEEEAIELCKLQTPEKRWPDIDVHDVSHCDIHFTDGSKWYGDGVEELNDLHVHFDGLNANQFAYLLSRSFDLFNLIDSGLAIDQKTINQ